MKKLILTSVFFFMFAVVSIPYELQLYSDTQVILNKFMGPFLILYSAPLKREMVYFLGLVLIFVFYFMRFSSQILYENGLYQIIRRKSRVFWIKTVITKVCLRLGLLLIIYCGIYIFVSEYIYGFSITTSTNFIIQFAFGYFALLNVLLFQMFCELKYNDSVTLLLATIYMCMNVLLANIPIIRIFMTLNFLSIVRSGIINNQYSLTMFSSLLMCTIWIFAITTTIKKKDL